MASNTAHRYPVLGLAPKRVLVAGTISLKNGVPSILEGEGFTVADTATGKVTVTLSHWFAGCVALTATRHTDGTSPQDHFIEIQGKAMTDGILSFVIANIDTATFAEADAANDADEQVSFTAWMRL